MPTLPLFTPNVDPDASHRVIAPGGYESWHFDAESAAGDIRLVAALGEGCPSDADYWRRYVRYRRRPTRRPPPLPSDYPWAHVAVYEREQLLGQVTTVFPPTQFAASTQRPQVTVGANEFVREIDGTLSLRLRGAPSRGSTRDPRVDGASCLSIHLMFRPLLPQRSNETSLPHSRANTDGHFWVVSDPVCEVSGIILSTSGDDASGSRGREIDFRGRGYHDHRYGTGPLAATFKRIMRGRAIFGNVACVFQVAQPLDGACPDDVRILRFDADGVTQLTSESISVEWVERAARSLTYPIRLVCGTRLRLTDPRVIDRSSSSVLLVYQAAADGASAVGTALCEVAVAPKGLGMSAAWLSWSAGTRGAGV